MATCPYCLEQIAEHARKCRHCHSVLDGSGKDDKDGRRSGELADFVIKFVGFAVGVLTALGAIAAIVVAIIGFKSLRTRSRARSAN